MGETTQRLEIVTPEKKIFSEDVTFVVVPGELGELGILPNHAPLMSSLKIGELRIHVNGEIIRMAISGGFVEINKSKKKVTVLADTAERAQDIDRERAEKAKERAEKRLTAKSEDVNVLRAEMALKRALNRLKISQK